MLPPLWMFLFFAGIIGVTVGIPALIFFGWGRLLTTLSDMKGIDDMSSAVTPVQWSTLIDVVEAERQQEVSDVDNVQQWLIGDIENVRSWFSENVEYGDVRHYHDSMRLLFAHYRDWCRTHQLDQIDMSRFEKALDAVVGDLNAENLLEQLRNKRMGLRLVETRERDRLIARVLTVILISGMGGTFWLVLFVIALIALNNREPSPYVAFFMFGGFFIAFGFIAFRTWKVTAPKESQQ
jgi:hypothetical protein